VAAEIADRIGQDNDDWPGMDVVATGPTGFVVCDRVTGIAFAVTVTEETR
jgi:hypothetical protein